ncbi:sulfite oxidase subunit YedZ [Klebsiella pneumoniae]|uniref:Sulfite oxidase subunit YedZ n=1 Tax=Klebsiella pneumoniae TaxID=573 RepID=A0A377VAY4_KLEPN|nr:sulfite oxidase subunit YedZ [Klebsiella pneumoniae]
MISWAILLALAVTSTQAMQRKLGRRWQLLHNFVYLVAILAPDTLPVVSEDRLAAARYICPAGSGAIDMALQEVPPVVARNPVMCSFPQILYQPRLFFR